MSLARRSVRIRDPIHGTIRLSPLEMQLVDHPAYQRLRSIKQLGFADLAFPGATHSRYVHGLGTLHVASRMFEAITKEAALAGADYRRLRQILRLAALFHDLGHAPLSHTTERFMPPVSALGLGAHQQGPDDRRATHEDYTLKILLDSSLSQAIDRIFAEDGVRAAQLALLISHRPPSLAEREGFIVDGEDWLPVLRQCVSSELDADRMDYLLRDSYFAGVPYGRYDIEWLLDHLLAVPVHGALQLGLDARAAHTFEDYLLSRFHMFLSVYLHHRPVAYELLLNAYHDRAPGELSLPADIEDYLRFDDISLIAQLRASQNPWAMRVVERRAFRRLAERQQASVAWVQAPEAPVDLDRLVIALKERGIATQEHTVEGRLSKWLSPSASQAPGAPEDLDLLIVSAGGRVTPLRQYAPLYHSHASAVSLSRVYVDPARYAEAQALLTA